MADTTTENRRRAGKRALGDGSISAGGVRVPQINVLEAARLHWRTVAVTVAVMVVSAGVFVQTTPVTYTAETQLSIAGFNLTAPGALSGFSTASSALASTYTRTLQADGIVEPIATRLDTSAGDIRSRLSSTPIPDSPVFKIIATGDSAGEAVTLANLASRHLVAYLERANRSNVDAQRLLRRFRAAARLESELTIVVRNRERALELAETASNRLALARAREALDVAALRGDTFSDAYRERRQAESTTSLVQFISKARAASQDRSSRFQKYLFAGLLAGLVIGLALASLQAQRLVRRRLFA